MVNGNGVLYRIDLHAPSELEGLPASVDHAQLDGEVRWMPYGAGRVAEVHKPTSVG